MYVNKISEVLNNQGIGYIRPTEKQLDAMGISLHTWNKWYRKTADPELKHISAIAEFLNCTADDLVGKKVEVS